MKRRLLIIDDELGARESLRAIFGKTHEVFTACNALEGLSYLSRSQADLIILDLVMPKLGGVAFLKEVRSIHPDLPVLVVTATESDEMVNAVLGLGAIGLLRKPYDVREIRNIVQQSLSASDLARQQDVLAKEVTREFPLNAPLGHSATFRKVMEQARASCQSHVLLVGEPGTGKEYMARQIHGWSARTNEPFVSVTCGSLPTAFMEAEIFGSWDKAGHSRRGALDLARHSTLYIDNLGRLPKPLQSALVRLLLRGDYQRSGSQQSVPSSATILASLGVSVADAVSSGILIPELAEAFSLHTITIPALRERRDDIPLLAYHFLHQFRDDLHAEALDIDSKAMQILRDYHWPGNVRELRNVLERVVVLSSKTKRITSAGLPVELAQGTVPTATTSFDEAVGEYERKLIEQALDQSNGTLVDAARVLHTTPRKLQYRIDKLCIRRAPYLNGPSNS